MAVARRIRGSRRQNFERNRELVARIEAIAKEKGCTPAQLTLAWLLAQGPDVVAIPGTRYQQRLDENVGALRVKLTPDDVARISAAIPNGAAAGHAVSGGRDEGGLRVSGGTPTPTLPRFAGEGTLISLSREAGEGWGGGRYAGAVPRRHVRCRTRG